MSVLICGGAGYIGSHNVRAFRQHGDDVIVVDSLETGHRASVPEDVKFYEGDIRNSENIYILHQIFHYIVYIYDLPLSAYFFKSKLPRKCLNFIFTFL